MNKISIHSPLLILALLMFAFNSQPLMAQDGGESFKELFNRQFSYASRILGLAEVIPAEIYSWRPDEDVRSVGEVFTHIAYYNFYYPQNSLGIPVPEDVEMESIESISGKEDVVAILEQSIRHLQESVEAMPDARLSEPAQFYGTTTDGEGVLTALLTHMSEHIGQAIAYARMNGVAPPW